MSLKYAGKRISVGAHLYDLDFGLLYVSNLIGVSCSVGRMSRSDPKKEKFNRKARAKDIGLEKTEQFLSCLENGSERWKFIKILVNLPLFVSDTPSCFVAIAHVSSEY